MKIKIYGFEWMIGKGLTIEDFADYLGSLKDKQIDNRIVTVGKREGYITGLFLTIKDMKTFCKMKTDGSVFQITPEQLKDGSHLVDFNFFIIYPQTCRGLYQHYHHSAATTTFCQFCKAQYAKYRRSRVMKDLQDNGYDINDSKQEAKLYRNKYNGLLKYNVLVRPESFDECVRDLQRIKTLEYTPTTFGQPEKLLVPDTGVAKRITHRIVFNHAQSMWSNTKDAVIAAINNRDIRRATATGFEVNGKEVTIKLNNDYQSLSEYEYEDMASTVDLKNLEDSVQNTYIMDCLIDLAKRPHIKTILERSAV